MVVGVVLNSIAKNLQKEFDYIVPKELESEVIIGSRVFVPFANRKVLEEAIVISLKESSNYATKEIEKVGTSPLTKEQIAFAKQMANRYFCSISDCMKLMLPPGTTSKNISSRVKEKQEMFVYLKKEVEEIEEELALEKVKSSKQARVLEFLLENEGIERGDLEAITDVTTAVLKTLEKNGYLEFIKEQVKRSPFVHKNVKQDKPHELTKEQKLAYEAVQESLQAQKFKEFLLYGVTGSGKTEVYLQLIEAVLNRGKMAMVLVPEISLTPQMVSRFRARFGEQVAVLHSKLSLGERYDEWHKIANKEAKIVIGARSAVFAPVQDLGIVIIDEEHDNSYKSDTTPRYHAKDLARYFCKKEKIPLVLGSATPDVVTYYKAKTKQIELLPLSQRATGASLPEVEIVDLREELAMGNKNMMSKKLQQRIEENLKKKEQTILFLNRRGYSTFVMCRECGHIETCKNCNITLTYHQQENRLKCHYCGYTKPNIIQCPNCNSNKVKYFGIGTQKLEEEVKMLFPSVSTLRMDIDTVTKKNSHEKILEQFKEENIDVLIGTQMVVKGHHFPKVTLVGAISADSTLAVEDYRANERTFGLLTQVSGRAGRESLQGRVIVQTYNPDHFSILASEKQNYDLFYEQEILLRKQLNYPPFCDIILVNVSSSSNERAEKVIKEIYQFISKQSIAHTVCYQPQIAPVSRIKNQYRWRMILKGKLDQKLIDKLREAKDIGDKDKMIRIMIDTNPSSMM